MDPGDKILFDILKDLDRIGILRYLVLIGGWCHRIYRKYYDNPYELTALTTYDLDLVIKNPEKIQIKINIPLQGNTGNKAHFLMKMKSPPSWPARLIDEYCGTCSSALLLETAS